MSDSQQSEAKKPDYSQLPMEETPTARFDNDGHLADVSLTHGEPLNISDEERAALPPLSQIDPDLPHVMVSGITNHPDTE